MKIAEFLREDLILPELRATDKASVLREICEAISRVNPQLPSARLSEVLLEREKLGSTGVGDGVAIPHGKLSTLNGLLAAFGRSRSGIDFQSIDGKPTYLFFVLFAPENSAGIHLKALARISRLFKTPSFRTAVVEAKDAAAIHKQISEEDAKY
ncbi:MAG: PTS sugar transporter subunit IIA [Myxococcales bacterium]